MTKLIEYIERKERGVVRIQSSIQKKADEMDVGIQDIMKRNETAVRKINEGMVRKAEEMALSVEDLQVRMKRYAEEW